MSTPARLSAIPLHFQGSYHLARRREDLAQSLIAPSSDSLKGALAAAWVWALLGSHLVVATMVGTGDVLSLS